MCTLSLGDRLCGHRDSEPGAWAQILALPHASCVALGELLPLSVPPRSCKVGMPYDGLLQEKLTVPHLGLRTAVLGPWRVLCKVRDGEDPRVTDGKTDAQKG